MKIVALKTYLVPPRWLFLKIETDDGIAGWGEPVLEGRAETLAALIERNVATSWSAAIPARSTTSGRASIATAAIAAARC